MATFDPAPRGTYRVHAGRERRNGQLGRGGAESRGPVARWDWLGVDREWLEEFHLVLKHKIAERLNESLKSIKSIQGTRFSVSRNHWRSTTGVWLRLPETVYGVCDRWVSKKDNKVTVDWESDASSSTEYLEVCSTLITSPQPSPSPSPLARSRSRGPRP